MALPVPPSWSQSAIAVLGDHYHGDRVVLDEEVRQKLVQDFVDNDFRETFFRVIGHRYLMALQRTLTVNPLTKRFTRKEWATKLGVEKSTIWRWEKDKVFGGAEKFFAAQLLLADLPLSGLVLPGNDEMLQRSVFAMYHRLSVTYCSPAETPLTAEIFRCVSEAMRVMTFNKAADYNPYDTSVSEKSKTAALKSLARYFDDRASASDRTADRPTGVLTSQLKIWLDSWGMPYVLFAMGNRLNWKQIGVVK